MTGPPLLRRRTALGGLAAGVLPTGCDNGDEIAPTGASSGAGAPSASATDEPEQTPDQALVEEVLGALTASVAVLVRARKAPGVRAPVTAILRARRRHVEVLEGDPEDLARLAPVPDARSALRLVRQSESALHTTLTTAAGQAESGALARLLASMSASVSQHLAVLPDEAS